VVAESLKRSTRSRRPIHPSDSISNCGKWVN
jgi:hypothetical protein